MLINKNIDNVLFIWTYLLKEEKQFSSLIYFPTSFQPFCNQDWWQYSYHADLNERIPACPITCYDITWKYPTDWLRSKPNTATAVEKEQDRFSSGSANVSVEDEKSVKFNRFVWKHSDYTERLSELFWHEPRYFNHWTAHHWVLNILLNSKWEQSLLRYIWVDLHS